MAQQTITIAKVGATVTTTVQALQSIMVHVSSRVIPVGIIPEMLPELTFI